MTQTPSVDSNWPNIFDPALNHFGKEGLLFHNFYLAQINFGVIIQIFHVTKIREFGQPCQSACAMQLAILKWPCDTNTKQNLVWPKTFSSRPNWFWTHNVTKTWEFGPLCQSACAMQLAVLKWPCDTNTKASLGKCPHKKGGWCQKQKSEQGIANWLWGAKTQQLTSS